MKSCKRTIHVVVIQVRGDGNGMSGALYGARSGFFGVVLRGWFVIGHGCIVGIDVESNRTSNTFRFIIISRFSADEAIQILFFAKNTFDFHDMDCCTPPTRRQYTCNAPSPCFAIRLQITPQVSSFWTALPSLRKAATEQTLDSPQLPCPNYCTHAPHILYCSGYCTSP